MKNLNKLFILTFFIQGCSKIEKNNYENLSSSSGTELHISNSNNQSINYLALGDSYTIGEGLEISDTWPKLLEKSLEKSLDININTQIIAETGMSTKDLLDAIIFAKKLDNYSLVSLLIGVNNQFRGMKIDNFRDEFTELIDTSIELTKFSRSRVFVLSIPDWSATPFGQNFDTQKNKNEIAKFNNVIKKICRSKGISFFDITSISRKVTDNPDLVIQDGLHPSKKMYQLWVDHITPQIIKIFD